MRGFDLDQIRWHPVRNDSGEEIPAYGDQITRKDYRGKGITLERFAEMARFNYGQERLASLVERGQPDDDFRALMHFQITRAREFYARGLAGVWLLPPDARAAILVAGRLYRAILATIEANDYDVLQRRAVVSRFTKGYEALISLALVRLWGDRAVPPLEHGIERPATAGPLVDATL